MSAFQDVLAKGTVTPEEAFKVWDAAPTVESYFMIASWKGFGFPTGHSFDGALESGGWYGKNFHSADKVDPLVYKCKDGGAPWPANPDKMTPIIQRGESVQDHRAECEADGACARLRRVEYRGQTTAAMVYNTTPVIDLFRKIDDNTVMGVMDNITIPGPPFFFYLVRA